MFLRTAIQILKHVLKVITMLWYFLFENEIPLKPLTTANAQDKEQRPDTRGLSSEWWLLLVMALPSTVQTHP